MTMWTLLCIGVALIGIGNLMHQLQLMALRRRVSQLEQKKNVEDIADTLRASLLETHVEQADILEEDARRMTELGNLELAAKIRRGAEALKRRRQRLEKEKESKP